MAYYKPKLTPEQQRKIDINVSLNKITLKQWNTIPLATLAAKFDIPYQAAYIFATKRGIKPVTLQRFDWAIITQDDIQQLTVYEAAEKYGIDVKVLQGYAYRNKISFKRKNKADGVLKNLTPEQWANNSMGQLVQLTGLSANAIKRYADKHGIQYKRIYNKEAKNAND